MERITARYLNHKRNGPHDNCGADARIEAGAQLRRGAAPADDGGRMTFRGVRSDRGAVVLCDGKPLALPKLRTTHWLRDARHSPTGFEWGYGGSGPAELARAILMRVYPDDDMVRNPRCYQRFKADVIQQLPREAFTLTETEVRAWRAPCAKHAEAIERARRQNARGTTLDYFDESRPDAAAGGAES